MSTRGVEYGIVGEAAPEWNVAEWFNLPRGETSLRLDDLAGKVVYLYAFQSWCPGCHSHGFPSLVETMRSFDDPFVAYVAVQTVFEGFDINTAQAARDTADKFGLDIPVAHDVGAGGAPSPLMRNYRTGGTPWVVLIDAQRTVRFNEFSLPPTEAVQALTELTGGNPRRPS